MAGNESPSRDNRKSPGRAQRGRGLAGFREEEHQHQLARRLGIRRPTMSAEEAKEYKLVDRVIEHH